MTETPNGGSAPAQESADATAKDATTTPLQDGPETDWKAKAREWESRAKSNRAAVDELNSLRQGLVGLAGGGDAKGAKPEDAIAELTKRFDAMNSALEVERLARVNGITDEQDIDLLRKSAPDARETLAARLKSANGIPSFDGGPRGSAPARNDMNRLLRQAAGRE